MAVKRKGNRVPASRRKSGARAPGRRRLGASDRRRQLLRVAHAEFASRGYDRVSMSEIAKQAGVTKPILYRHFGSKDGLCAAAAELMVEPMLREVREATAPTLAPDGQLWAGILAQLGFIDRHRDEWRVFVREAPARGGPSQAALAEGRRRVTELLADLMRQALRTAGQPIPQPIEVEAQAHCLQGAVEQIANWWEAYPNEPVEGVAVRVMNFAWQGFGDIIDGRYWLPADLRPEEGS
jgi:AcrR family transcriptional regulator